MARVSNTVKIALPVVITFLSLVAGLVWQAAHLDAAVDQNEKAIADHKEKEYTPLDEKVDEILLEQKEFSVRQEVMIEKLSKALEDD